MTELDRKTSDRSRISERVATTAAAWAGAYATVSLVVAAGGPRLAAAPRPLQMLVISGILVLTMSYVLMPLIGRAMARVFAHHAGHTAGTTVGDHDS
jgi:antibiotic biosynthesis monooxygenase (ABM) superfamily enzyme